MKKTSLWILILVLAVGRQAWAQRETEPKHLTVAKDFVEHLDLKDTGYNHGDVEVKFDSPYESHTDCSGFVDALLEHCYGIDKDQMKKIFGSGRPTARRYHDAIVEQNGFKQIQDVRDIRPGDILAIKYITPRKDSTNTGHLMIAADRPHTMGFKPPEVLGTTQWAVTVIDSSRSGHGPTDTRHKKGADGKDHDGVGEGVFRIYTKDDGKIVGFGWSTLANTTFKEPKDEHLVVGRIQLDAIHADQAAKSQYSKSGSE